MATSSQIDVSAIRTVAVHTTAPPPPDRQLIRWGAVAGLVGAALMLAAALVVVVLDLPDASDVETLTDFADIESGRIAEHFLYLGALVLFTMHVLVLHRMLRGAHSAASLFGAAIATIGFVIMAASSVLHVSTAALSDLYTDADTPPEDLPAIEYAWHGAQSVFDTMLATGVLLVPIGLVLLGVAMLRSSAFGPRLTSLTLVLGVLGALGATVEIVDTGIELSALSVLAIVVFHLAAGWRTLQLADEEAVDLR